MINIQIYDTSEHRWNALVAIETDSEFFLHVLLILTGSETLCPCRLPGLRLNVATSTNTEKTTRLNAVLQSEARNNRERSKVNTVSGREAQICDQLKLRGGTGANR